MSERAGMWTCEEKEKARGGSRKKKWQQISRWKTAQQWSRRRCRWSREKKKGKGSTRCSETDKGQYVTKAPLYTRLRPSGKNVKSSERENRYRENKEETNCEEWMWRCSPVPLWLGLIVAGGWQARSVHGGKSKRDEVLLWNVFVLNHSFPTTK